MHVLMASPIPSHPQDQGNSARITALGRALQAAGAIVHFLYFPLEGLTPAQRLAMAREWDFLHVVPTEPRSMMATGDGFYRLDDWYDPRVGEAAASLQRRFGFAAVIANYVWFSGILESFGPETVKVLDTHDVFGGRDNRFRAAGLTPEWFFTSAEEEARGLARADLVLAIQPEEAALFSALGHPNVRVIGHLRARRTRAPRGRSPVTIGYLASFNPINRASFAALRDALPGGVKGARLLVAGTICERLDALGPFEALGRVDNLDEFYDQVDVVANPMEFGTGLKIKSVEAVFEGLPLVATTVAMAGLPARHRLHQLANAAAVASILPRVVKDATLREELAQASVACAELYAAEVRAALAELWSRISEHSKLPASRIMSASD